MLIHCCVVYLKDTNVKNYHQQYQCIADNGTEESVILIWLLVEQQHRKFQFCVSGRAVFLVSCKQCSLGDPTDRTLKVLIKSGERGGYSATPLSLMHLPGQTHRGSFSHRRGNAVVPRLVASNSSTENKLLMQGMMLCSSTVKQTSIVTVASKRKDGSNIPLEAVLHATCVSGKLAVH